MLDLEKWCSKSSTFNSDTTPFTGVQ